MNIYLYLQSYITILHSHKEPWFLTAGRRVYITATVLLKRNPCFAVAAVLLDGRNVPVKLPSE